MTPPRPLGWHWDGESDQAEVDDPAAAQEDHWATSTGVAACGMPARLERIHDELAKVGCRWCLALAQGRRRFPG